MTDMTRRVRVQRLAAGAAAFMMAVASTLPHAQALVREQVGGTVFLSTVPAEPGVRFDVGGARVTTGPDGSAAVASSNLNGIAARVRLSGGHAGNGAKISISRVVSGPHVAHESHLSVGLDITSSVRLKISSGATYVSTASVHSLRLTSVTGTKLTIDPQKVSRLNLLSRRTRLVGDQLTTQVVTWSVARVTVAPGVAMTAAQGRFDPGRHSIWAMSLQPIRGDVVIHTVPRTAGAVFLLDGATITTGPNGTATAPINDLNNISDRLQLANSNASNMLVSNLRVSKLPPHRVGERVVMAELDIRRAVALRFVDPKGSPIPTSRIADLTVSSGNTTVIFDGAQLADPVALLTESPTKVGRSWQSRLITYSLRSVRMDGGQAVFNGRQRFQPSRSATWTISLAVFSLSMTAHDALFGNTVSSRVVITRPNGTEYPIRLGDSDPSVARSMVRGLYGVTVDSAVLGGRTSVLVSRDDKVDLRVVTLLESVVLVIVVLIIISCTVVGGRMMARRRVSARAVRR